MNISELIVELERLKEKYGDIRVVHNEDAINFHNIVVRLEYTSKEPNDFGEVFWIEGIDNKKLKDKQVIAL